MMRVVYVCLVVWFVMLGLVLFGGCWSGVAFCCMVLGCGVEWLCLLLTCGSGYLAGGVWWLCCLFVVVL